MVFKYPNYLLVRQPSQYYVEATQFTGFLRRIHLLESHYALILQVSFSTT